MDEFKSTKMSHQFNELKSISSMFIDAYRESHQGCSNQEIVDSLKDRAFALHIIDNMNYGNSKNMKISRLIDMVKFRLGL